jgi:diacylglycerol kinase (ATP)
LRAFTVIVNPTAGFGRAAKSLPVIRAAFEQAGVTFVIRTTDRPGHARELAREADPGHAVIAAGGDGTVQEVARGLVDRGGPMPMGIIPIGTGNDFVQMLGTPGGIAEAVAALVAAPVRHADYGTLRCEFEGGVDERVFLNCVGIGFDGQVASVMKDYKRLSGWRGYLAAVLVTLSRWAYPSVRVTGRLDDDTTLRYEGDLLLVTASNGCSTGGGFYLTRNASAFDGQLDACLVERVSIPTVLRLIPRVLRKRPLNSPFAHEARITELDVRALGRPLPVHADGEPVTAAATRIHVEIVRGGLPVLVSEESMT